MALVYNFGGSVLGTPNKVNQCDDAIKKALVGAGCSPEHAQQFLEDLDAESGNIITSLTAVNSAYGAQLKGKNLFLQINQHHKTLAKVFAGVVLKPQFKFQARDFNLSVHKKGQNVQLWMSYPGGGTNVLVDTPARLTQHRIGPGGGEHGRCSATRHEESGGRGTGQRSTHQRSREVVTHAVHRAR